MHKLADGKTQLISQLKPLYPSILIF